MRSTILILFLLVSSISAFSQFSGFQTLKNKFGGKNEVFSITTSGFFARGVLLLAGEHDFKSAIKHIDQIRLITIPKPAFAQEKVTVNGFKKLLAKDSYEELTSVRDHDDEVTLYIQSGKRSKHNRYFLLVEGNSEVVAIEIKGYIDPKFMLRESDLSYNNHQ
jgi:hypothetical protein